MHVNKTHGKRESGAVKLNMFDFQAGSGVDDDDDDDTSEDDEDDSEEEEQDREKLTNGTNRFSIFTFVF